jgi:RNase H-fold protein (predicted Holliday junction resolvase)
MIIIGLVAKKLTRIYTMIVLSLDPGTAKCGLAALAVPENDAATPPTVLRRAVVTTGEAVARLAEWAEEFGLSAVLVGDATGGAGLAKALRERFGEAVPVYVVPERGTSERARARYWRENPPRGWKRLLPVGLQTPPEPYDDYAAVVLAEDWLAAQGAEPG